MKINTKKINLGFVIEKDQIDRLDKKRKVSKNSRSEEVRLAIKKHLNIGTSTSRIYSKLNKMDNKLDELLEISENSTDLDVWRKKLEEAKTFKDLEYLKSEILDNMGYKKQEGKSFAIDAKETLEKKEEK